MLEVEGAVIEVFVKLALTSCRIGLRRRISNRRFRTFTTTLVVRYLFQTIHVVMEHSTLLHTSRLTPFPQT